jgi:citrate lyase subunit beta / citryl-CoA lyase
MKFYRSVLYMPASRERAIAKARTLACDAVILDLEDSVAPETKVKARQNAIRAIGEGGFGRRQVVLRVNGLDTPWGRDDLAASADLNVAAVLVPKVSSPDLLRTCRAQLGPKTPLWAMIETCASIINIGAITNACEEVGLTALVIGTNDLAKEMRCRVDEQRTALVPALIAAVLAARAYGVAVLDGVYNDLKNANGFRSQCVQGLQLGFDGKTLIHPDQIAVANEVFSPSAEEIAHARAIVEAFSEPANAGKGVITVGGKMTELLHLAEAHRTLAIAETMTAT